MISQRLSSIVSDIHQALGVEEVPDGLIVERPANPDHSRVKAPERM